MEPIVCGPDTLVEISYILTEFSPRNRCHDNQCEVKEFCRRWLDREDLNVIHSMTLRPNWQVFSGPCSHAILTEEFVNASTQD
jgi:hypothetical protein